MKKLISMTEFIMQATTDSLNGKGRLVDRATRFSLLIQHYAELLQTPLSLSMFIPCNEKGEPIEKPSKIASFGQFEYQKALESVLFEGWYQKVAMPFHVLPEKSGSVLDIRHTIVEDLINSGIELTPSDACKKSIGI